MEDDGKIGHVAIESFNFGADRSQPHVQNYVLGKVEGGASQMFMCQESTLKFAEDLTRNLELGSDKFRRHCAKADRTTGKGKPQETHQILVAW